MATTGARPGRRMVSLGKVTAPKPINLPSQRRENNGLDPSVNLVSKASTSGVWGADGPPPPGQKDGAGNWPAGTPTQGAPAGQQPPIPRSGSAQGAAWGGAGLPEVRQATALLSKEDFPTLGTAADDGATHKRRESSRLSNRGSDLDRGHWDSDDRAIDHDYRAREYGEYDRYDRHPRDGYPPERDWGQRHPPPPPRRGYDGYDDYYRDRYSPDERRRDDGYFGRGPPPHHGGYRDQPPPPPPRSGYHDGPYREDEGPRGRRTPDWAPPPPRDGYRGPPSRPERDWDGPDGPPRERSNGYGHHGPRHPRAQPPPPPPPRRAPVEGDEGSRKGPVQRFSPEWGRQEAPPTQDIRREQEDPEAHLDTPTRSPRRSAPGPPMGSSSPRQPTKVILKRDGPPEVPQDPSPPPPPPRAARRAEAPPPPPRGEAPPPPPRVDAPTQPPKQPVSTLPVARDPVLPTHGERGPVLPTHGERGPAVPPRMQPGAPSVQQQMQQLQQAQPPSAGLGLSTQLHGLFPNQYGDKDASRVPLAGLQEGSLPVSSMGGGAFVAAKPADLHKAQQQQQQGLNAYGGSLSGGLPAFNLFGPTAFNPMQQGHALFTPDLLGTAQGLSSPSAPRGPLDSPARLPSAVGGPLATAAPTSLSRPTASPGGMLFGQFGDLASSPPVRAGVQMPSAVTAVAAAEAVVNEGQPASYEEQRVFMLARAAQKKEERRTAMEQQSRGKPIQPSTPSAETTQPGEGPRGRRRGGRGASREGAPEEGAPKDAAERKPSRRGSGRGGRGGGNKDAAAQPAMTSIPVEEAAAVALEADGPKGTRSRSRGGRRSSNSNNAPTAGSGAPGGAVEGFQSVPVAGAAPSTQSQPQSQSQGKSRARGSRGGGGRTSGGNNGAAADAKSGAAPQQQSGGAPPGTAQATAPPRARPRSGGRGRGRGGPRPEGSAAPDAPAAPVQATATA